MTRKKLLYQHGLKSIFKISRANIQSYLECARCFYLNLVKGISKPKGLPLPINMAIDSILKNEFDYYRNLNECHPEVKEILKLNLKPLNEDKFFQWRKEASIYHEDTNFNITGKFDDVWVDEKQNKLFLADYKSGAVSKDKDFTLHESFRNQMDIYYWIAKQLDNRFVATSYFYFKRIQKKPFMNESNFITEIVEYEADDRWVEEIIQNLKKDLESAIPPKSNENCQYCQFIELRKEIA